MAKALKAVLFDLDGTLLDTAPDFITVINQMLADHQRPAVDEALLRSQVSNGARAMVTCAFQTYPQSIDFAALHTEMLERYSQLLETHIASQLYPGINELLTWLESHQIRWGIVTNKPERFTRPLLERLELTQRCGPIICPDHVAERKPDPQGLLMACEQLGCTPAEAVYVGDHARDIEAGRNAGMPTIAAAYGYLNQGEDINDWHSDYQIEHASQIQPLLQDCYALT